MKNSLLFLSVLSAFFFSCKKASPINNAEINTETLAPDNFSSLNDFFEKNGVPLSTFTIIAEKGGTYVSTKGTSITIPPNTFSPASATITIEFKDIYSKSDFLLSGMPAVQMDGSPLISGGQFYLRALNNNLPISSNNNAITVTQPSNKPDKSMVPYMAIKDTTGGSKANYYWTSRTTPDYSLLVTANSYISSFFVNKTLNWYNTDHPYYSSMVSLTVVPNEISDYMQSYMVFKNENSSAAIFQYYSTKHFICYNAPKHSECTIVTFMVKNNKIFASFKPVKLDTNQVVNAELVETNSLKFKADLKALD